MKPRKPEGLVFGAPSEPAPRFLLDEAVYVQLWQRIPPGDKEGVWKDTGKGFIGTMANGPGSRLDDPADGQYWYVMPDGKFAHDGEMGNIHPRPISEQPFEVVTGEGEIANVETLRFVVVALDDALKARS